MKRVIFENNPLVEMILQFRFPTILSINANEPVAFQETIRQEYPIYQPGVENQQEIQIVAKNNMFLPSIGKMNNIQACAREIVDKGIIYV